MLTKKRMNELLQDPFTITEEEIEIIEETWEWIKEFADKIHVYIK